MSTNRADHRSDKNDMKNARAYAKIVSERGNALRCTNEKEDGVMKTLEDVAMARNTGKSFVVRKGQRIRIYGESVVDLVPLNLDNLKERFDQARTKLHNNKIFITTGDKLYTKFANPIMTIVDDTYRGKHNLEQGMCSKQAYDRYYESLSRRDPQFIQYFRGLQIDKREALPDHGCWENLQDAFNGYGIAPEDIPSPFNLFASLEIVGEAGTIVRRMHENRPEPGKPAHVDLRAEMNCLVGVSACPERVSGKAIRVQVFDE